MFFVLTLVMAVLPALREQAFPAAGRAQAARTRGGARTTGLHARGLRVLSHAVRARLADGPSVWPPVAARRLRARESSDARHPAHGARSRRRGRAAAERGLAPDPPLRSARGRAAVGDAGAIAGTSWRRSRLDRATSSCRCPRAGRRSGKVIVAGPDAVELVRYLLSLKQAKVSP